MNNYKSFFLKQILPILITAFISAIITALQTILTNYTNGADAKDLVTTSAGVGASLKACQQVVFKKC